MTQKIAYLSLQKEIGSHHLFAVTVRARQARHAIPCRRARRSGFRCLIRSYLRQRAKNVLNVSNLPKINLSQSHRAGGTRGHQNKPQGKLLGWSWPVLTTQAVQVVRTHHISPFVLPSRHTSTLSERPEFQIILLLNLIYCLTSIYETLVVWFLGTHQISC